MPAGVRARRRGWGARTPGASAPADTLHMVLNQGDNKCQMMNFCWQTVLGSRTQTRPDDSAFLTGFVRVLAANTPTVRVGIATPLVHAEDAEFAEEIRHPSECA